MRSIVFTRAKDGHFGNPDYMGFEESDLNELNIPKKAKKIQFVCTNKEYAHSLPTELSILFVSDFKDDYRDYKYFHVEWW